jgi:hypothetical protein
MHAGSIQEERIASIHTTYKLREAMINSSETPTAKVTVSAGEADWRDQTHSHGKARSQLEVYTDAVDMETSTVTTRIRMLKYLRLQIRMKRYIDIGGAIKR